MKMKMIRCILFVLFFAFLVFSQYGCKGGNPFNFMIGKMTKSVEKKQSPGKTAGMGELSKTNEGVKALNKAAEASTSHEDSSRILEAALGIEKFVYKSGGRRDPFETLFKGKELNVENVKLVGTVWGPKGRFALLKEPGGTGYVVGIGDKIADGRVIGITNSSVTFEIRKFGVTSKVTLILEEKEEKLK